MSDALLRYVRTGTLEPVELHWLLAHHCLRWGDSGLELTDAGALAVTASLEADA